MFPTKTHRAKASRGERNRRERSQTAWDACRRSVAAVVEHVERRVLLSGTLHISGDDTAYEGQDYELTIDQGGAPPTTPITIDWGDGNTDLIPAGITSAIHDYGDGPAGWTITATGGGKVDSLDASFANNGRLDLGNHNATKEAMAVQGNQILVADSQSGPGGNDIVLRRFNEDGSLDTSFGGSYDALHQFTPGGGSVQTDFKATGLGSGDDRASQVIVQPDGQILVVGTSYWNGGDSSNFALARYSSSGAPDETFGGTNGNDPGTVRVFFNSNRELANAAAVADDGSIVVGGDNDIFFANTSNFVMERYTATGAVDTTFGSGGRTELSYGDRDVINGLAFQTVGGEQRILVTGKTNNNNLTVGRYTPTGVLDTTFAGNPADGADPFAQAGLYIQPTFNTSITGVSQGFGAGVHVTSTGDIVAAGTGIISSILRQWRADRV
jgi:uncharacterized delta-60 repeat protein